MTVNLNATLGDLVVEDDRRARVLEQFELDYCCNGHRTLAAAALEAGLDAAEVARALEIPDPPKDAAPAARESAALAHEIIDTHHAFMWEEMPRLIALVVKVHGVHGERHPELGDVRRLFEEVVAGLDSHMTSEERVVFPAISRMERDQAPATLPGSSFDDGIEQLRVEHDKVGEVFKEIRTATSDYTVPDDGCASYRAMMTGLRAMELDLHTHIHKENNILFPKAQELHRSLSAG